MVLGERSPGRVGRRPISNEERTIRRLPVVRFSHFRPVAVEHRRSIVGHARRPTIELIAP